MLRLFRSLGRGKSHPYSLHKSLFSVQQPSSSKSNDLKPALPKKASVVVCGGGIIGCSVAYHLAKHGCADVVVLEQGQISGGTTWHAAGLVGKMRGTQTEVKLSDYAAKMIPLLEQETGLYTGWRQCGSLTLARNESRMILLERNAAKAQAFGIQAEIISPQRALELFPVMQVDDIKGALWLPEDGTINPSDFCQAYKKGATMRGVRFFEGAKLVKVVTEHGSVVGVEVEKDGEHSFISTDSFVNCGGQWAREIGKKSAPNVTVPLHSAEHYYIVSKAIEGVTVDMPLMRDPDGYTYFREWSGGILAGGFEPKCKPTFMDGIPDKFEFQLFPDDWDHFSVLMEEILLRMPCLANTEIRNMVNGPESFTPDNQYILGSAPEIKNYYVAAGFNSSGIASSAGAGNALSQWIINQRPPFDLWVVDVQRFAKFMGGQNYLHDRTLETLGLHYQIPWPRRELETAIGVRRSPIHSHLKENGAVLGRKFGFERSNWFNRKNYSNDEIRKGMETFGRQIWWDDVKYECLEARNNAVIFDQTSFAKFTLEGEDAKDVLQKICANNMEMKPGKVVYTQMLNDRGGIETDIVVVCTGTNEFLIISSTGQATRDRSFINSRIHDQSLFPHTPRVYLRDVTNQFATFSLAGPRSLHFMKKLSPRTVFEKGFPYFSMKEIEVGYAHCFANRVSYVGELGYELFIPQEMAAHVFEKLMEDPNDRPTLAGYYAINSLRMEKCYRAYGHEISPNETPLEAGLEFAVDFNKPCFVGKEALVKQKNEGTNKKLVNFVADIENAGTNGTPLLHGGEPILMGGKVVGFITSADYSFVLDKPVAMGYVNGQNIDEKFLKSQSFEARVEGRMLPLAPSLSPLYDPEGQKLKFKK